MTGIDPSLSFISPVLFISLYSNTLGSSSLFFPFRFSHSLGSLRLSSVSSSLRESASSSLSLSPSMALFVLCAIEGKHRSLHARGTDPVVSYASVAYSHTLFVLCAIEVLTVNTGTLPVPPLARVPFSDPFAILSHAEVGNAR